MSDPRPSIPADIKRRVLVEAGHRCAIPQCRHIEVEIHHITPWADCQTHDYENLIALCPNDHRRADRGEIDRKALRLYKINLRFAHDKFSQLELDIIFELQRVGVGRGLFWPKTNLLMIKRILDVGYVVAMDPNISMNAGGYDAGPVTLSITQKGLQFVSDMGEVEL